MSELNPGENPEEKEITEISPEEIVVTPEEIEDSPRQRRSFHMYSSKMDCRCCGCSGTTGIVVLIVVAWLVYYFFFRQ